MKRKLVATLAAVVFCGLASTEAAQPIEELLVTHLLLGGVTNGNISEDEWNECATELGGRPANTRDVITLPWAASETEFEGWVNPFIVAAVNDPFVVDISGEVDSIGNMTCRFVNLGHLPWSETVSNVTGFIATKNSVMTSTCDTEYRIVCAIPVMP